MKKPERLVYGLTEAYQDYLSAPMGELTSRLDVLNQRLTEFVNTNIIFWGTLNLEDFSSDILLTPNNKWKLVHFIEDETKEKFIVPVRVINFFSASEYCLPKIFKIGKYYLGDVEISVDKTGHFTISKQTAENDFYIDFLSAHGNDKAWFADIVSALHAQEYDLLNPIDPERNYYQKIASTKVLSLTELSLILKIKPLPGIKDIANTLSKTTAGITRIAESSTSDIIVGLKNGYVNPGHLLKPDMSIGYVKGMYYKLSNDLPCKTLITMRPFNIDNFDENVKENHTMFYGRESYLREAK